MGGKALKNLVENNQVIRVNEQQLLDSFDITKQLIENCFNGQQTKVAMPKYIKSKETFGDLDFIVGVDDYDKKSVMLYLMETFNMKDFEITNEKDFQSTLTLMGVKDFKFEDFKSLNDKYFYKMLDLTGLSKHFFPNGNIVSFSLPLDNTLDINNKEQQFLQVDLIFTSLKNFESTYNYLSNNDFSNFLGRLARAQGLKYGVNGLYTDVYYNGMNANHDIQLTANIDTILETLDLDVATYHKGFNTFDDMFEYLATSQHFNPMIFDLDYRNHDARQRDNKRDAYKKMLEFCDGYERNVMSKYINQNLKDVILKMSNIIPNIDEISEFKIKNTLNNIERDLFVNGIKHIEKILLEDYGITFEDFQNYNTDIQYVIKETLNYPEIKEYLKDRLNINTFDENDSLINTIVYFNQLKRLKENVYEIDSNKMTNISDKFIAIQELIYKVVVLNEYLPKGMSKSDLKLGYLEKFGKLDEYLKVFDKFKNQETIKQYFNGNIISEIYGVKDIELGNIIKAIKGNDIVRTTLNDYIINIDCSDTSNDKQKDVNEMIIKLVTTHLPTINYKAFETLDGKINKDEPKISKALDI